ncbi:MAG: histidine kinase [Anaerolineales bacterium]|nr:histidine kinase [Anaerolineales bacterium]
MRASDSPFVADWFIVSLRWLVLLGLTISLSLGGQLLVLPNALLIGLAGWNIALTLLTGLNRRLVRHREISLGVDLLAAGLYFALAGGFASPAFWIIVLPLFTAAIYFEVMGAFISATLMMAVQIGMTVLQTLAPFALLILGASVFLTFLIAGVFGYLSMRLIQTIRLARQSQFEEEQKKQRTENDRLRATNDRLRAIYGLTSTLMATLNYQRVLDSILDLSLSILNLEPDAPPDDRLICAVLLFSKEESLEVGSARRLTPADMRVVLRGQKGAIAQAIENDKPVLLKDVRDDPELTRFVTFMSCNEIYCFPLRSGFNAYGVLLFGHPELKFFTAGRRELLDILGSQAVVAIQNARLYQDVVDERERMIEFQEEARKKLARDLHDGPTQSVSAIAMRANIAQRMLSKDPKAVSDELGRIEDLARRTTKEIRHMLFTLRPLILESQGLVAALQSMAEKTKETFSQNVLIKVDESILESIEMGKQGVIFYIVEEAVNNARKHAQAGHIWVNLRLLKQGLALLVIQDDGIGFDVVAVNRSYDQRGSLGMVNLRDRTELVNGVLDVQSVPGKGTRVQVYIPLTEEAADRLHHSSGKQ